MDFAQMDFGRMDFGRMQSRRIWVGELHVGEPSTANLVRTSLKFADFWANLNFANSPGPIKQQNLPHSPNPTPLESQDFAGVPEVQQ